MLPYVNISFVAHWIDFAIKLTVSKYWYRSTERYLPMLLFKNTADSCPMTSIASGATIGTYLKHKPTTNNPASVTYFKDDEPFLL